MKSILFLFISLISTTFFINLLLISSHTFYKIRYDACDEKWANETLWSNYISHTNSTICDDSGLREKDLPMGFVTLIATAFANRNISCGVDENTICNPLILNNGLKYCREIMNSKEFREMNLTLFDCIGLKKVEKPSILDYVNDYILDGYTILAAEYTTTHGDKDGDYLINRFLIEGVYERIYVKTVDIRGKSSILHHNKTTGYEIFRVLKPKKNRGKNKNKVNKVNENIDFNNNSISNSNSNDNNNNKNNEQATTFSDYLNKKYRDL
jgi:hypothetical protein